MESDNTSVPIENKTFNFSNITDFFLKQPVLFTLIAVLTVIVYGQTVKFGYTYLDDKVIIVDNILNQKPIINVKEAFKRDAFFSNDGLAFYRPLQNLSYMLDARISGKSAWYYHLVNLILHFLTVISVYYLFRVLKYDKSFASIVALLYTIHPIFTHAVAWIPSRGDLLIALFGIISYIAFIKMLETKSYLWFSLNVVSFLIAVFSKETAALIPLIYISHFILMQKKKIVTTQHLILFGILGAIVFAYFMARSSVIITQPGDNSFGFNSFIKNLPTLPEIISKFFIPVNLSTMPKYTAITTSIGIFFIISLIVLSVFIKNKKYNLLLLGLGWFLLFAVPPMAYRHNYADFGYEYFEHRSYLPMIGMFIILFELYKNYRVKIDSRIIFSVITGLIIIFSAVTFVNAKNYNSIFTFFGRAISVDPKNALGNYNMGNYSKEIQKPKQAIYYFEKAIKANPEYLEAYQNLADALNFVGRRPEAIKMVEKALNVNAYFYNGWKYLGVLYMNDGSFEKSRDALMQAFRLRQKDAELFNALGGAYLNMKKNDSAIIMFKKAIELKPDYKEAISFLSNIYKDMGDYTKSSELLEKTKTNSKESVGSYITLGEVYGRQGNFDKSLEVLEKAIQLDPKNARAYNNMGTAYAIQKKFPKALECFQKAVQYDSLNASYLLNLGLCYNDNKKKSKAIEIMKKAANLGADVAKRWLIDNKVN